MIFVVIILAVIIQPAKGQNEILLEKAEESLQILQNSIRGEKNNDLKHLKNLQFFTLLAESLKLPGSFSYPFDSLKWTGRVNSPDNKFRILNWNLPLSNGSQKYYGIIQVVSNDIPETIVIPLTDHSDSIFDAEHQILDQGSWYGALYYKVIPVETSGNRMAYFLLGWHGKDAQLTQKIIEVLLLGKNDSISFGAPLFKGYCFDNKTRIIFNFSASASMVLRYEDQRFPEKPKWDPKTKQFVSESEKVKMIVFDHLVPLDPNLEGQFQFYVPSSDQTDGFIFEKGSWVFVSDIDARNKP